MEVADLLEFSEDNPPQSTERTVFGDLSNGPITTSNTTNLKSQNIEEKIVLNNEDLQLFTLIQNHLGDDAFQQNGNSKPVENNPFTEKSNSPSQEQQQPKELPRLVIDIETPCSVHKTTLRTGHTRQSIFKQPKHDEEHIVNKEELKNQQKTAIPTQSTDQEIVLIGKSENSLKRFICMVGDMAKRYEFDIVRSSEKELLIRKRRKKSFIERYIFSVVDPIVIQLIIDEKSTTGKLYRIAGTPAEFTSWRIQLFERLWEEGELVLTKQQELTLYLNRFLIPLYKLKSIFMEDPVKIRVISDRRKTDLHKNFKELMGFRLKILFDIQKRNLDYENFQQKLDRFLIKQSGILVSYKEHFRLLEYSYRTKRKLITKNISIAACLQYLEVEQVHELLALIQISDLGRPYQNVMDELVKLDKLQSPEEKLSCLVSSYRSIKDYCNKYHEGRVVLEKMDNMLPIMIYIILYTEAVNLLPNLAMLEHYVVYKENCSGNYELQRRILTNLNVAIEYIITSWDYPRRI